MRTKFYITLLLTILIVAAALPGISQTKVFNFTYDSSGNRTERRLIQLKSSFIEDESLTEKQVILEDELYGHDIKIYPNPTKGRITINISGVENDAVHLLIYNAQGSLIKQMQFKGPASTVDLSQQPDGIYVLKILIGAFHTEWKIVKN